MKSKTTSDIIELSNILIKIILGGKQNATIHYNPTVTLVYGNGTDNKVTEIKSGEKFTFPSDPTRRGYDFKGWNGQYKSYDEVTVTTDVTYTASWEETKKTEYTATPVDINDIVSTGTNVNTGTSSNFSEQFTSGSFGFYDVPDGAYYYDAVSWAVLYGITSGTSANTFSPADPCTRAQIATFLYRTFAR